MQCRKVLDIVRQCMEMSDNAMPCMVRQVRKMSGNAGQIESSDHGDDNTRAIGSEFYVPNCVCHRHQSTSKEPIIPMLVSLSFTNIPFPWQIIFIRRHISRRVHMRHNLRVLCSPAFYYAINLTKRSRPSYTLVGPKAPLPPPPFDTLIFSPPPPRHEYSGIFSPHGEKLPPRKD